MNGGRPSLMPSRREVERVLYLKKLLRHQAPTIWMRLGARLASAKLALLSALSATSGATNSQGGLQLGFHNYMMHRCAATNWSIVTSAANHAILRLPS